MRLAESTGISQAGQHVFTLKLRIASQHVIDRVSSAEIRQNRLDGYACAANHRFPTAHLGIEFDAVHGGEITRPPTGSSKQSAFGFSAETRRAEDRSIQLSRRAQSSDTEFMEYG